MNNLSSSVAISGQSYSQRDKNLNLEHALQDEKPALKKIADYFEPRETTSGDLEYSSPKKAAFAGGVKGLFSGGITGAAAGVCGGYVGVRVGEETGSMTKALAAGGAVGAGTLIAGSSLLASAAGGASVAASVGGLALAGAVGGGLGAAIKQVQNNSETELNPSVKTLAPIAVGVAAGAAAGAISGPVGAVAGAVVGGLSAALSKPVSDEKSAGKASLLSAAVSAGAGAVTGGVLAAASSSNPINGAKALSAAGLLGGLTGASAVISGSRESDIRDASAGGFTAAALTEAFTGLGGGTVSMAASIGGAVGARFENKAGKVIAAGLTGGALGAAGGAFAGPVGAASGAALGASTSIVGAVGGPKVQQGIRNFTEDLQKKIQPFSEKVSSFIIDKLGEEKGLTAVGAITGALGSIPVGLLAGAVLGPIGAAAALAVSAIAGGFKFSNIAKELSDLKTVRSEMAAKGPSLEDINSYMCQAAFKKIEPQLANLSPEEKKEFYEELYKQSFVELKTKEKEIKEAAKQLADAVYAELKPMLGEIDDKEDKQKFISGQISSSKPVLTNLMAEYTVSMLQSSASSASE